MNYKDKNIRAFNAKIIFLLIVILGGMFAYFSTHFFIRADLTEVGKYAVSDSTKKILGNLDDLVNVRVYFSKQLPPDLMHTKSYVKDILGEYNAYANGNLNIEYLDPGKKEIAAEAQSYGIPQIQMNVYTKDKFEVQNGYLGLAILYEDKFESIPVIENTLNMEYNLTSAILKVTADKIKTVGFTQGNGEPDLIGKEAEFEILRKSLSKNYKVTSVNLEMEDSLNDVDTLIIAGTKDNLEEKELYALDQFIASGGNTIFLVDTIDVGEGLLSEKVENNLNKFLANIGVQVSADMVLDQSNEHANFSQGYISYIVPYPFWVKLIPKYFNEESPIVAKLSSIVLPWMSALEINEKEGFDYSILATTTPRSSTQSEPFNLNPNINVSGENAPELPMITLVTGSYTSYFKDTNIEKLTENQKEFIPSSLSPVRIFVVGGSDFVIDSTIKQFPQNTAFLMNAVDYLTMDESLIGIRSKVVKAREIKELSDSERVMIKFFGIYFIPIFVIIFGLLRAYWLRKVRALKNF